MSTPNDIPRCKKCGKHYWFEPCKGGNHRESFILQMIKVHNPDLLPDQEVDGV